MHIPTATTRPVIKILTVIEATTVISTAKILIESCQLARNLDQVLPGAPALETSIATFCRGLGGDEYYAPGYEHDSASECPNEFVAAARDAGIEVHVIGERFRFDPRAVTTLRSIAKRLAPDIIETNSVKSHFLMRLSGLWQRHTWLAFHHGYTTTDIKMRAYNRLDPWSLAKAHRVVTVCRSFARDLSLAGIPPEQISVLHSTLDASRAAKVSDEEALALRESLGVTARERVVLAVGRLSHEKGHVELVAALDQLRRIHPELHVRLVIAGEGPERQRIERAARQLGIGDRVTLAGHVSNIAPYYRAADALALPSHSEGSPMVLLEAMAAGLPVVATAVGGVPEVVTHDESAMLVNARDPRAMAKAIGRVLLDERLQSRLTENARALVIKRHSPESRLRSLVEIYRQIIAGRVMPETQFA